ncbi:unnamed protein product, partial [Rotaria sordida]
MPQYEQPMSTYGYAALPQPPTSGFSFGASSSHQQFSSQYGPCSSQASLLTDSFGAPLTSQQYSQSSVTFLQQANIDEASSLFSSSMTEQKIWPSNDQDIVRHLINLQKFDGLWNLTDDDIQNLCHKPLKSFHSIITNDSIILTTVIVIII